MSLIAVRITSRSGDKFAHLVRAIQMLGSYGDECRLQSHSDVLEFADGSDGNKALTLVALATSRAGQQRLADICREVAWSLGEGEAHTTAREPHPAKVVDVDLVVLDPSMPTELSTYVSAGEFAEFARWGDRRDKVPDALGDEPGLA